MQFFFTIKYFGLSIVHFYFYVAQITSLFGIPLRQERNYKHAADARTFDYIQNMQKQSKLN